MDYQKKLKQYQQKGLTKSLIKKYCILSDVKYFYSGVLQNYFVSIAAKSILKILLELLKFIHENLIEFQKKVLKR